jgi:repressor LexA
MVARLPGKARGLKLSCVARAGIRVLGSIAAGNPREALQDSDELIPVSPQFFRGTDLFALRVKGDSMKDVGILPGDIAVMNRQPDVADGEIAAVLLDDDATLKFLHRQGGAIVLRGANPAFPDIVLQSAESRSLRILGKYVGLIRQQGGAA